ncbi:MAG: hypothetical protein PHE49_06805 [bacterium]|nr:hypothetical protein [bacterium]
MKSLFIPIVTTLLIFTGCRKDPFVLQEGDITLVDKTVKGGAYYFYWDQTDNDGNKVGADNYGVYLCASNCNTSKYFTIEDGAPHIAVPHDTLSMPTVLSLSLTSEKYAIGDTVTIKYQIPATSTIKLFIRKE